MNRVMSYDSTEDTLAHITVVQGYLHDVASGLTYRGRVHDRSKLADPEKATFDEYTPRLASLTYGTPEYKQALVEMSPALEAHYSANPHHPEHWPDGIRDMSLLDIIEMLVDWKAAGERHADGGDIMRSIRINQGRFGYSGELRRLLENTARELGW